MECSQGRRESLPTLPTKSLRLSFQGAPPTENSPGFKLPLPLGAFLVLSFSYQGVAAGLLAHGSWLCLQLCLASRLRGPLQVLEPHGLTPEHNQKVNWAPYSCVESSGIRLGVETLSLFKYPRGLDQPNYIQPHSSWGPGQTVNSFDTCLESHFYCLCQFIQYTHTHTH